MGAPRIRRWVRRGRDAVTGRVGQGAREGPIQRGCGVDMGRWGLVYFVGQGGPVVAVRDRWARQFCSLWRR